MYKIVFRGDDRTPFAPNNIFGTGLLPREPGLDVNFAPPASIYGPKIKNGQTMAGDIQAETAVCVTANFRAAPIFPLNDSRQGYIYVAAVEVRKIFQTHLHQWADGKVGLAQGVAAEKALWPLFAEELAVVSIPAANIMGAIEFEREPTQDQFKSGVQYTLGTVYRNRACTLPGEYVDAAYQCLTQEVEFRPSGTTPRLSAGFSRSEWTPDVNGLPKRNA